MAVLPVFPLGTAYLPGDAVALTIFEQRYVQMLNDVTKGNQRFVSVLIERGSEVGGGDLRHDHGVEVEVSSMTETESVFLVIGVATVPCTISHWLPDDPYPRGEAVSQIRTSLSDAEKYDVASSLTLLGQNIRLIHETLAMGHEGDSPFEDRGSQVATIAAGRWWDQRVTDSELWQAFWVLARNLPSGPFDRYSLLTPGTLTSRVKRLKQTVEHVHEVVSFRFEQ